MAGREFAHVQLDNAEIERSVLSQEVEALRNRLGLRQVDVSKECGVNASMLSQWMLGSAVEGHEWVVRWCWELGDQHDEVTLSAVVRVVGSVLVAVCK
ncbi:hypothetical protein PC123_g23636 [Phytophthora cactorum]|nr:hypothetical protein PC123_g23636 [Phytophthora cactorum]